MAVNDVGVLVPQFQNGNAAALARNTLKYQITAQAAEDVQAWDGISTALGSAYFDADLRAFYATDSVLLSVVWYGVSRPEQEGEVTINSAGTSTGEALPLVMAPFAQKKTGRRGRPFQGHMFLPSPVEAVQNAGLLTAPFVTAVGAALENIRELDDGAGNQARLMLAEIDYMDEPPTINNLTPVSSFVVQGRLRSLRLRRPS